MNATVTRPIEQNVKTTTTLLGLGSVTQSQAVTLYVDRWYGPCGNGSTNAPNNTIQAAINDGRSTGVIIHPGTYMDNQSILKCIRIIRYDGPHTTAIDGSAGSNVV